MNSIEILRRAREVLSVEQSWARGAWARNADGQPVFVHAQQACSWCIRGALRLVCEDVPGTPHIDDAEALLASVLPQAGGHPLSNFNDASSTTHADVIAAIDRAITIAEAA